MEQEIKIVYLDTKIENTYEKFLKIKYDCYTEKLLKIYLDVYPICLSCIKEFEKEKNLTFNLRKNDLMIMNGIYIYLDECKEKISFLEYLFRLKINSSDFMHKREIIISVDVEYIQLPLKIQKYIFVTDLIFYLSFVALKYINQKQDQNNLMLLRKFNLLFEKFKTTLEYFRQEADKEEDKNMKRYMKLKVYYFETRKKEIERDFTSSNTLIEIDKISKIEDESFIIIDKILSTNNINVFGEEILIIIEIIENFITN